MRIGYTGIRECRILVNGKHMLCVVCSIVEPCDRNIAKFALPCLRSLIATQSVFIGSIQ